MNRWSLPITRRNSPPAQTTRFRLWPLEQFPRAMGVFALLLLAPVIAFPDPLWSGEEAEARYLPSITIAPPHPQPIVGERLSFQGRWIGIPVGYGWVEVKGIVDLEGRRAYHIEAEGFSNEILSTFYPIHDVVHSYLDVETLQPLRFEKHQREGRYRADEVVTFDLQHATATYRSLRNQSVKEIPLPPKFQDIISALYWFRAQAIRPNEKLVLDIYTDEKIYQAEIFVKQPMILELLKRGTFPCILVEPKASFKGLLVKRGRVWAYLSADEHRLPLLIKATTPWGMMTAVIDEESLPPELSRHR